MTEAVIVALGRSPIGRAQKGSSSLQTTRMAAHAIWAGEGHAFLSVGVECVSRYGKVKMA